MYPLCHIACKAFLRKLLIILKLSDPQPQNARITKSTNQPSHSRILAPVSELLLQNTYSPGGCSFQSLEGSFRKLLYYLHSTFDNSILRDLLRAPCFSKVHMQPTHEIRLVLLQHLTLCGKRVEAPLLFGS